MIKATQISVDLNQALIAKCIIAFGDKLFRAFFSILSSAHPFVLSRIFFQSLSVAFNIQISSCFLFTIFSLAEICLSSLFFPLLLVIMLYLSKLLWMIHPGWSAPVFHSSCIFSLSIYSFRWKDEVE